MKEDISAPNNNMDDTTTINNDDASNNDNIISSSSNDDDDERPWGTWEELLLACAVKRHGFKDWDSIAMEVQTKSSLPRLLTTAQNCKQKYHDLKRRFKQQQQQQRQKENDEEDEKENSGTDKIDSIPWLEQLRSLRVAELKRELQRYDVSILSLQLKVKKLEEERELQEQKPDLANDRSENDKSEPERTDRDKEASDRSVNESNSTGRAEADRVRIHPDPVRKEESSRGSEVSDSGELGESGDVESSASLGRERRRIKGGKESAGGDEIMAVAAADAKSEPLLAFLDVIRAHRHGSLFERRLQSQESKDYKNLIRQHLDLEMVQTKQDQGNYSSSTLSFYRDLLLLFTNAIAFFPKSSSESLAAHELRALVSKEIKKDAQKRDSNSQDFPTPPPPAKAVLKAKPELEMSDALLAGQKHSAPLVVCRKRSSVSTKLSSSSSFSQKDDKKAEDVSEEKEKPVTGTRSSRRNNKGTSTIANSNTSSTPNKKKQTASNEKQETPKTDNKKASALDKKKSMADFLKRIKKNSLADTPRKGGRGDAIQKKNSGSDKKDKGKERILRSSNAEMKKVKEESSPSKKNVGRPSKKGAETAVSPGKRGRESGGGGAGGKDKQKQKKRARR